MHWRTLWNMLWGKRPPLPPHERDHDEELHQVRNHAQVLQLLLDRARLLVDTESRLERGDHPRE
jgi:hypothetical protein